MISAICVAIPATIAACVAAYKAWMTNKETRPNGGNSMRDAIDSIARDVRDVKADVRVLRDDQRSDHERITRLESQ